MPDVQYPDDPRSNPSTIRIEDLLAAGDAAASPPVVPVREGLPRTFRMRADKHYVEMLDGPPPGSTADVPSLVAPEPESSGVDPAVLTAAVQAGRDLAQSLAALRASTNLLSERGPALASSVAANLIRAEAWRSTCLLQASRFLRGEIAAAPKAVRVLTIVDRVLQSIEPERRLRSLALETRIDVDDSVIAADEDLLVSALSGLLMATIALTEDPAFTVVFAAELRGSEIGFAIIQEQVRPTANWATEWPATSALHILATCNGRLAMTATSSGTDVRVVVPRLA